MVTEFILAPIFTTALDNLFIKLALYCFTSFSV